MNTTQAHEEEIRVRQACLRVLEEVAEAHAKWVGPASRDGGYDGEVELKGAWGRASWLAEIKGFSLTKERLELALGQIHQVSLRRKRAPLLMVNFINPNLAARAREAGVNYVDVVGNAWLKRGSLHVRIEGHRPQEPLVRTPRPLQSAGLRLVTLFLEEPASVGWTYRAMADASGVSLGSVNGVLDDLRGLGHLRVDRKGDRHLAQVRELFERWELGYLEVLRPKLSRGTYRLTGTRTLEDLAAEVERAGDGVQVGGELGAARLTKYLRAERATLYLGAESVEKATVRLRLAPDPQGVVDLLDPVIPYRAQASRNGLTSPWLIHAELVRALPDGRIQEVATVIFEHHLAPRFEEKAAR